MTKKKQQKSQKRFQTLFKEGLELSQQGMKLASVEKKYQAVHSAPSVWTKHRYFAFGTAIECKHELLVEGVINHYDVDLAFEQKILDDETEPAHFRATAANLVAQKYLHGMDMNTNSAAEMCRLGLDIIANSPKEDDNRQVFYAPHVISDIGKCRLHPNDYTLKTILRCLEAPLRGILLQCETKSSIYATSPKVALLFERAQAGGTMCDCCGKTLEELQLQSLMRCARCQLVFYCSKECQSQDWKHRGHRRACRKIGQIEVGDDMQMRVDLPGEDRKKVVGRMLVKVIARVEGTTNRWQVKNHGTGKLYTVDSDKLNRIRPPPYSS